MNVGTAIAFASGAAAVAAIAIFAPPEATQALAGLVFFGALAWWFLS